MSNKPDSASETQSPITPSFPSSQPLIFISHDTRDAFLAEAFSKLLSSVSAGVLKSFRSSDKKGKQGIEYGVEWYPQIMRKLESASDVVCILTKRSVDRPWLLYEAGVAKGKLDTPVHGLALGIPLSHAAVGPFAQFQNSGDDIDSITKLVLQLLERIPNSEPDIDAVQMQVESFKKHADEILSKLKDNSESDEEQHLIDETSVAKLFEEVKIMFQDLPARIDGKITDVVNPIRRRRIRHFEPFIFEEIAFRGKKENGRALAWLVFISLFRDDLPWIFEVGMEVYRAIKSGRPNEIRSAMEDFQRVVRMTIKGPLGMEFMRGSKDMHMMIRDLDMTAEHFLKEMFMLEEEAPAQSPTEET